MGIDAAEHCMHEQPARRKGGQTRVRAKPQKFQGAIVP